jgi:hypothetical protein
MKWIGQHIYDLIARFRSDVYLEDISSGTIASGGNLGLDSDNKIVKATISSGSGDITGVDLTGTSPINIGSETGTTSGDYSATISVDTASTTNRGVVELATTAETTTGTDTGRAVTPDGLKDGYQGSTNVTTLGIIGTGQWRGTPIIGTYIDDDTIDSQHYADGSIDTAHIADDQVTEDKLANTLLAEIDANTAKNTNRAYFEFKGYGTSDGTNYEMPEIITDNNAPFIHDTSTGSDGLTAQTTNVVIRSGGIVMPHTGVLKKFTGWASTAGTGTVDVGIFKFTPVDNDATNVTPVLLVNEQITGAGNTKMRSFSETSSFDAGFTAGDIIYSAVKGGTNNKTWYLTSTIEVEWS